MKNLLLSLVHSLARAVIRKHQPFVVGVTGTVGKTTTTHFVYDFLHTLYGDRVFMSPHNYNGEFGLPFTILGVKSPYSNPFLWIWVFIKGFARLFDKKYPKYLVLEYGIDHKGEMKSLLEIVKPDVGILLNISKNHLANFGAFSTYIKEKLRFATACGTCIYNLDDENITLGISDAVREGGISFSARKKTANVYVRGVSAEVDGISFDVCSGDVCATASYPVVGSYQAYNLLPVFALGIKLGLDIHDIVSRLSDVHPQRGRGSVLKGIKESIIIDGSYNGGYAAITGGISYLAESPKQYARVLFLGDMRELGDETKELHDDVARQIIELAPDGVVLVGEEMRKYVYHPLVEALGEDKIAVFASSRIAGAKVRELLISIERPSIVFVKWSQNNIFLEEGIKEFLFDLRDTEKLCRQSLRWMKIKNHFFDAVVGRD